METSQLPERARVSIFPLLPLFVFPFVISKRIARLAALASLCAHARNYRPQANANTKLQQKSTSDTAAQRTAHSTWPTAQSTRRTQQSAHSTKQRAHTADHTKHRAHNTEHAAKPHKAQSTQHRARSKPHKAQNTPKLSQILAQKHLQNQLKSTKNRPPEPPKNSLAF